MIREDLKHFKPFDSHLHIIDHRFPLLPNRGYLPASFSCEDYLRRTRHLRLAGGAVVSGSLKASIKAIFALRLPS